jgi:translation initiation factor IF-2
MSETQNLPRLLAAAKEFNVGKDTIVELLVKKGLLTESEAKPTLKLSMEMYNACHQEFSGDKQAKAKSDALEMPTYKKTIKQEDVSVKPAVAKEGVEAPKQKPTEKPDEEDEIIEPIVEAPKAAISEIVQEQAPVKETKVETKEAEPVESKTSGTGIKVLGTIDLSTIDSSTKPKKVVKKDVVKKDAVEEKKEPTEEIPNVKKTEEPKPPVVEKENMSTTTAIADTDEETQIENIKVDRIEGPKILGKIDLPVNSDTRPKPSNNNKDKRKRKRIPVDAKGNEGQAGGGNNSNNNNSNNPQGRYQPKPQGGGGRFKPGPPGSGVGPGQRSNNNNNQSGGGRNNDRRAGGGGRHNDRNAPREAKEIDQKEIQDKIRQTQAKLTGNTGRGKSLKAKYRKQKREGMAEQAGDENVEMTLQVTEFISVSELASLMDVSFADVISKCMGLGIMVSINQRLDAEVIELVASEFGFNIEFIDMEQQAEIEEDEEKDEEEDLSSRSPIVTIMGHVDHGKTSLLDYIRNATVVAGEAGGITQHVGAYEVELPNGKHITFLDTPGHEAFTAMRARGAKVTDIAVIVVAADDAVMPQTKEAISHAQAAGVPMIFAVNKIDKEGANSQKIYEQLSQMNLLVEEWGGKYQHQEISAKKGLNIDLLLEKILLEAEMLDLKANPDREAQGSIIESNLDKGRGYVSTILVQNGTLQKGDLIVSGQFYGRVKAMFDERQKNVKDAGPSKPAVILGLNGAPQAGEKFKVYSDEAEAKEIANKRAQILREQGIRTRKHITLDEIGRRLALGSFKELKLIIKGDVDGSVEALTDSMQKLSTQEILISVIHKGVGQINESDVVLAEASDAIIIGFNVRPSAQASRLAEGAGIQIKNYSIIYKAIDEIKLAMEGMLEPSIEEKIIANIEIREVFKFDKVTVAGCYVTDGKAQRNAYLRVIRDGIVIFPASGSTAKGEFAGLRRHKDDVKEVATGYECGVTIKNFIDYQVGDVLEVYEEQEVKRKL